MEKSRKLEFTKILIECCEAKTIPAIAIIKLFKEGRASKEEISEFFELSQEERSSLYDEVYNKERGYSIIDLKLAAILKKCYDSDSDADVCLSLMLSLTNAELGYCIEFIAKGDEEHNKMFAVIKNIRDRMSEKEKQI